MNKMPVLTKAFLAVGLAFFVHGVPSDSMKERDYGPEFDQLTYDVVTPHFDWATQYEKGPLCIFSIGHTAHQRDAIELGQRFPLVIEHLNTLKFGFGYPPGHPWQNIKGTGESDRLEQFRTIISKDLDVIVPDGQFLFEVYPDEVTYKILDKVRNGAGLVIFTHYANTGDGAPVRYTRRRPEIDRILYQKGKPVADPGHFLSRGVPFQGLTAWSKIPDETTFESKMIRRGFGKGRILILTGLFPPVGSSQSSRFTPSNAYDGDYAEYWEAEYYYAFAMKAMLWASRKEPSLLIKGYKLTDENGREVVSAPARQSDKYRVELTVDGSAGKDVRVEWWVRNKLGEELFHTSGPLQSGKAVLSLPALGRGRYYVDSIIRENKTTMNWGATMLDVAGDMTIAGIESDSRSLQPDDRVKVTLKFSDAATEGMSLRLSAIGNFERLLQQERIALSAGTRDYTWLYRHSDRIGRLLRLKAELLSGARVLDTQLLEIPVRLPVVKDQFQPMIFCNIDDDFTTYNLARHLAYDLNFTIFLSGFLGYNPIYRGTDKAVERAARAGSRLNVGQWADIAYQAPQKQDNNVRIPCLTDPGFQSKARENLLAYARTLKEYGTMYFLGDENSLQTPGHDVCFSPTCQADFRGYLRKEYSDLADLNKEWGTTFAGWDEVTPLDLNAARKTDQPARWVDHRLHMSRVWVDIFRQSQAWIRESDPDATVGLDYTIPAHGDFGEIEMARTMSALAPTPHQIMGEAVRSLELPGLLRGSFALWGFGADRGPGEGHKIWDSLLRRSAFCVIFAATPGDAQSYIAPDFRAYSYFMETLAEAEAIENGLDKLILPLADKVEVGMVFSEAAQFAGQYYQSPYDHRAAYFAWRNLLWDNGINFHLVPVEDIVRPEAVSKYRLIILPACQGLSAVQAAALRKYVEGGGRLAADVRPGTLDEHGRILSKGSLDELFGIGGITAPRATANTPVDFQCGGNTFALGDALLDTGLKLSDGQCGGKAGEIPVLITKSSGKGGTILLNLSAELSFNGKDAPMGRALIRRILSDSAVYLPVTGGRANYYEDGKSEYVVVFSKTGGPCQVNFRQSGHLYDGRTGEYLGFGRETARGLKGSQGRWICRLPYVVKKVETGGTPSIKGGRTWTGYAEIKVKDGRPGRHVVCVKVIGPDGKEYRHYRQKLETKNGRAEIGIPFCWNDPAGRWTMVVTDVATGIRTSRTITLL